MHCLSYLASAGMLLVWLLSASPVRAQKNPPLPVSQSERLYAALKKVGADATLHVFKVGTHNLLNAQTDKQAEEFFAKHLKIKTPATGN